MKKLSIIALFLLFLAFIAFASPGSAEELQPPQASSGTGTQISSDITQDTVWTKASSPYIVTTTVDIYQNITLSIEPGVVIKFRNETGLRVGGNLLVNGTQSEPVLFGPETAQSVPSWKGLDLEYIDMNTVRIKHAEFTGATSAIDAGTYPIVNKNPVIIDHVRFANNQTALYGDIKVFNIASSVFENNGTAIRGSRVFVYDSLIRNNGGGVTDLGDSEARKDMDNLVAKSRIEGNHSYGLKGSGAIYDSTVTGNAYGAYVDRVFNGMFGTISIYLYDTKVSGNQIGLLSTTGDQENTVRFKRGELSDNAIGFDGPIPVTESNILRNGLNGVINSYNGWDSIPLQNNYWGTTDEQEVASKLKLGSDVQVNYVPLAEAPFEAPADAPVWPAYSVLKVTPDGEGKVKLTWPRAGVYYLLYRNGELLTPVRSYSDTESFTDTLLSPGQKYKYEVFAVNGSGILSETSLKEGPAPEIPLAYWPEGSHLEFKRLYKDNYQLSWTPAVGAEYYAIYANNEKISQNKGSQTLYSFFHYKLEDDTEYTFKVEALNKDMKETNNGPTLTVRTPIEDRTPPVVSEHDPGDNEVITTANPVISAKITDSQGKVKDISVIIENEKLVQDWLEHTYDEATGMVTAPANGLTPGKYKLIIVAKDDADNREVSITKFTVAAAPGGPVWPEGTTLTASNVTSSSLTLNWTLAQGATGYRIYRDGSVAGTVYGSVYSYNVVGLQPDTTYSFSVEAVDAAGHVSQNNPATTVKTKAAQGTAEAVRLQARPGFLNVGSVLELQMRADGAEDVYAFLAKLQYDPAKFKLLQASLHPEFGTEGTTVVRGYSVPAPDRVHVSGSLLGQTPGRSGDIGLAALRFTVLQQGSGTFTLQPDSQLANSQGAIRTLPRPVTLTVRVGSADFDQDGRIGLSDLVLISKRSGARVGQPGYDSLYDLNNDGVIDSTDVQYVADKVAG